MTGLLRMDGQMPVMPRCLAAGMDDDIPKPANSEQFADVLRRRLPASSSVSVLAGARGAKEPVLPT